MAGAARHGNISVFIPHMGCPNMCSFCNQRTISKTQLAPTPRQTEDILGKAFSEIDPQRFGNVEIAFFGGSFTAIDREYMTALLECAEPFLKSGRACGIRISTRPDRIDREILDILKRRGVTAIELGAQSMDDGVLSANLRGHTAEDVKISSGMIKEYGFELGLQIMTGLYRSSPEKDMETARSIIALSPETARVYPVVILEGTRLGELYKSGEFKPYKFDTAAELCADMLEMFEENGIKVIKLGLHASETVEADMLGGFYHPAFREICEGILFRREMEKRIDGGKSFTVYTAPNAVSKAAGQKKCNIAYFKKKGIAVKIRPDESLENRMIIVKNTADRRSADN